MVEDASSLRAAFAPYSLIFKELAITSRSRMSTKDTFLVRVWDERRPEISGIGECALFKGLSSEDTPAYEQQLAAACATAGKLPEISSIRFGFETAVADLDAQLNPDRFEDNAFLRGEKPICINGLVWMGDKHTMARRIREKLDAGFRCVKLKIGGIDFNDELELLRFIRSQFIADDIELRLDANGAFSPENALERLERLAQFDIHSIEQPIRQGQTEAMARLCSLSPIPIALDEELIGFTSDTRKCELLTAIRPQYIILKPSLCGGFREADLWITKAEELGIGWWATSALESNIGLTAIARWVSAYNPVMPQGLGTGALYTNNFPSPLRLEGDRLYFNPNFSQRFNPPVQWHSN